MGRSSQGARAIAGVDWRLKVSRGAAHLRADISFAVTDAFLIATSYGTALGLRLIDGRANEIRPLFTAGLVRMLPVIVLVHLAANLVFGTYGHVWEYASIAEAKRVVQACAAAGVALTGFVLIYRANTSRIGPIPIGSVALGSLMTMFAMGMVRFRSRLFSFKRGATAAGSQRVLIVGTSKAAADLSRNLPIEEPGLNVIGFLAPAGGDAPRRIAGLQLLGKLEDLPAIVAQQAVGQVIVVGGGERLAREVLDACLWNNARLRILPDLDTVLHGNQAGRDVRDLEITDLLPRPAVSTDLDAVAELVRGSRVLVTGAGGSIGSEIVRQLITFEPAAVIALDHDETHLYEGMLQWERHGPRPDQVLCDVRNGRALERAFLAARPDLVFHAAALKHVPILERCPAEAISTNVLGTQNAIDSARKAGASRFVLISTDKAVSPKNVMGSSKRVAELLVQAAHDQGGDCVFTSVRFGNVLGSRGSVVPTFIRQIQEGGPVTITDPDMKRYFMTVDEAVQLVLQAASLADGGEVFVLDMSDPVRIGDLAHRLIRLAGLVPGQDIAVEVTGRRPGEKLIEVLSEDPLQPTSHPKISVTQPSHPGLGTVLDSVEVFRELAAEGDGAEIRLLLASIAGASWSADEVIDLRPLAGVPEWS